jgi:hypothetical protein
MWINRKGKYNHVTEGVWTTRVWLLLRKIDRQHGFATITDRRVAVEILRLAPRNAGQNLKSMLEEVLVDAPDPYVSLPAHLTSPAPQEGMGQG